MPRLLSPGGSPKGHKEISPSVNPHGLKKQDLKNEMMTQRSKMERETGVLGDQSRIR